MHLLKYTGFLFVIFVCTSLEVHAQKVDKPLNVIVQAVALQALQNNIEALGNLHANNSVVITAKSTKTITQVHFDDGQRVKKGDVLIEMTNNEEAALMDEANFKLVEAKKQLDRVTSLAKTGAVSTALLDQSQSNYQTARAHSTALEARLKDLRIIAPFSGVMGIRNVSVGSLIVPGQAIAMLNDDSKMKLDFSVPAIYMRSLHIGMAIEARSYDLGDNVFKGAIISIDNVIDETTRSIKARAVLDNSNKELKQGMLMNVVAHADARKALVMSEAALVPMGSNNFVFLLQKISTTKNTITKSSATKSSMGNGTDWIAEKRQIQIGKRYRGFVEIVSGLNEGDKVVTHGLQKIHDGQTLNIVAEQSNDPNKPIESLSDLLKQKL